MASSRTIARRDVAHFNSSVDRVQSVKKKRLSLHYKLTKESNVGSFVNLLRAERPEREKTA